MKTHQEINCLACRLIEIKQLKIDTHNLISKFELEKEQFQILQELSFLIKPKLIKYKRFNNAQDLEQEANLALMKSLKTYKIDKGNFIPWAEGYIQTKISRQANKHSVFHIPISNKEIKPFKIDLADLDQENSTDLLKSVESCDYKFDIQQAINKLPDLHQQVLKTVFKFSEMPFNNLKELAINKNLSMSKTRKILEEAKQQLKNLLS